MDLKTIEKWLFLSWEKNTSHHSVKEHWNKNNKEIWQCAITSMLINKLLWWKILKADVSNYWFSHYWNLIDEKEIDFTYKQFTKWKPVFKNKQLSNFQELISNLDTKKRYELLKKNFEKFLKKN